MELSDVTNVLETWKSLSPEFTSLEHLHADYIKKLSDLSDCQSKCLKEIKHQQHQLVSINESLQRIKTEDEDSLNNLRKDVLKRTAQLNEMEQILPKNSGLYLKIILGNINVSILNKEEKYKYKDEYEKFKLIVTSIGLMLSVLNLFISYRVLDLLFMFLLVWYYCTLTIRESILKVNGSRIRGWWRTHHFISTVLSGVLLIWPCGQVYYSFRTQFVIFNVYIGFLQYLQFHYQRGCLYRLKALGQRHNMDITIEGFHSWMWMGLSYLLPFLFGGYFYQLYNAYTLYQLSFHEEAEWHEPILSLLFFILFLGNSITTILVIPQKMKEKGMLKYRFPSLNKYLSNQRKEADRTSVKDDTTAALKRE